MATITTASAAGRWTDRTTAAVGIMSWLLAGVGMAILPFAYFTFIHPKFFAMIADPDPTTRERVGQSITQAMVAVGLPMMIGVAVAMCVGGLATIILALRARRA